MSKKTRTAEDADVLAATLKEGDLTLAALREKTGLDETRVIRATNLLKAQRRIENAANGLLHLVEPPTSTPEAQANADAAAEQETPESTTPGAPLPPSFPTREEILAKYREERRIITEATLAALKEAAPNALTYQTLWTAVEQRLGREINAGTFAGAMDEMERAAQIRHAPKASYKLAEEPVSVPEEPPVDTEADEAQEPIIPAPVQSRTGIMVDRTAPEQEREWRNAKGTLRVHLWKYAHQTVWHAGIDLKARYQGIGIPGKGDTPLAAFRDARQHVSYFPAFILAYDVQEAARLIHRVQDESKLHALLNLERQGKKRKTLIHLLEERLPSILCSPEETPSPAGESVTLDEILADSAAAMAAPAPAPAEPSSNGDALKAENVLLKAELEMLKAEMADTLKQINQNLAAAHELQQRERTKRQRALLALKTLKHTPQGEALGASILREQIHSARHAFDRTGNPILKVYLPIDQLANRAVDMLLELERKHQTALETIDRLRVEARKAAAQPAEQAGAHG